ncbi:hypothetical protein BPP43_03790 [Brachyspira pilosicoli P43/6/78]|uniref:Uncharacterized protein n=1 Tax=Brachyspira pilosicoli P43/6/78 TaxID=1042417 RepID=A0A3B6VJH4_BRAPL|nr:hypothetical protein BPP43_03790 [Brachyspira pilosicoli P43/6/78]
MIYVNVYRSKKVPKIRLYASNKGIVINILSAKLYYIIAIALKYFFALAFIQKIKNLHKLVSLVFNKSLS